MNDRGELIGRDGVRFERLLPAPIERVWEYLTQTELMRTWLAISEIELRVGGKAKLIWESWSTDDPLPPGQTKWFATGIVTQCDPPRLLGFTWNQSDGTPESEITFELTPRGEDTVLVLTHRRLEDDKRHMYGAGWHVHLDLLATRLEGGERGDFIGDFKRQVESYKQTA